MNIKTVCSIIGCIAICFLLGFSASRLQVDSIAMWYPLLHKSALTPPDIVFPFAWGLLYICMGASVGIIVASEHAKKRVFIGLFALQMLCNFSWSIAFFYYQSPLAGLLIIILLLLFMLLYTIKTYQTFRVSSLLFFPYIAWVLFATYLNGYIVVTN